MSLYYIERNNMSGNGGMDQSQGANQGQKMNAPNIAPGMQPNGGGAIQPGQPANGASTGRDYRDDLRELLDRAHTERGLTRYRLCKQMGIDSGTLSNVLAKRRHFSLEKLEQILGLLGYRLSFTQGEAGANGALAGANGARPM